MAVLYRKYALGGLLTDLNFWLNYFVAEKICGRKICGRDRGLTTEGWGRLIIEIVRIIVRDCDRGVPPAAS